MKLKTILVGTAVRLVSNLALVSGALSVGIQPLGAQPLGAPSLSTQPIGTKTAAGLSVPVIPVVQLIELARRDSPLVAQAGAELAGARAGVQTAGALPNPEFEIQVGRSDARRMDGTSGGAPLIGVVQPVEWPALRQARRDLAEQRVSLVSAQALVVDRLVVASVRKASADWLRLAEEEKAAVEDLALTEQIRDRIAVSARAGETARFDLTRAETEMAIARKVLDTVRLRALQTKVELRRVVGASLPDDFQVAARGALPAPLTLDDYERLRVELDERNPDLLAAQTDLKRARQEIQFERTQVLPRVTLRATHELDPSSALTRVGAQVSVPLLDQRQGPIAQAVAAATRAQAALDFKKLEIQQGFASAWLGWQAAQVQLQALDSGIVTRARAILGTAEAAYRFGERGILETLDAQRQFRIVRNELIAARHAVALARIELERLSGL